VSSHVGKAETVWTHNRSSGEPTGSIASGAADAASVADLHIPEAPEVPECPEIRRRKDNKPDRFRLAQGPDMKYRLVFKCELCPYRTTRANLKILTSIKAHHMNKCHGGEGQLPKLASHKWFASRGKAEDFHWRCPLCRTGVSKVRNEISPKRLYQLKRQHKDQHHPEVSRSEWLTLMRAPNAGSAARKKRALCLGKSNVEAARLKLSPHIIPFTMPTAVRSRKGPCPIVERTIVKHLCQLLQVPALRQYLPPRPEDCRAPPRRIMPFNPRQLGDATFASEP